MAANTNGSGNLSLTTNLPGSSGRHSWSFKFVVKPNTTSDGTIYFGVDDAGSNWWQLGFGPSNAFLFASSSEGAATTLFSSVTTSHWLIVAGRCRLNGSPEVELVARRVGTVSSAVVTMAGQNTPNSDPTGIYLGTDGFVEQCNATFASFAIWDAVLAMEELRAELGQTAPVRNRDLFHYESLQVPIFAIGRDQSGRGRNFTRNGTWVPSNYAPPISAGTLPGAVPWCGI